MVEKEQEGYHKRIRDKSFEIEIKRNKSQMIKQEEHHFIHYKTVAQAQMKEEVSRRYALKE